MNVLVSRVDAMIQGGQYVPIWREMVINEAGLVVVELMQTLGLNNKIKAISVGCHCPFTALLTTLAHPCFI